VSCKAILLAGGEGSRLAPLTVPISKHLLPVFDKPLIYYSLSSIFVAGIKDILIICTEENLRLFKKLLGCGSRYGVKLKYAVQDKPNGIAEAFLIGEQFLGKSTCFLVLGDNIVHGSDFYEAIIKFKDKKSGASIFGYPVSDPGSYGVLELKNGVPVGIEEKPQHPKSNIAIPGYYFYDNQAVKLAKTINPSGRNELEITDISKKYLEMGLLEVKILDKSTAWFDCGTPERLLEASNYVHSFQARSNSKIGDIQEIAINNNWIGIHESTELF